ncbi:MAG: hypothetical protein J6X66_01060 [Lachnospiraceae bacterium]|nr:hypothetical protein [Lachnospiraceae bacterium]
MEQKKIIGVVVIILIMLTAVAAVIYLSGRTPVKEGMPVLVKDGKEKAIDLSALKLQEISGVVTNGKGEEKTVSGKGVGLSDITGTSGFTEVSVISDDAYSATVAVSEIENAYLQIEDGKARLIVFGDKNAKRDVKNVVRIEVK